MSMAFFLCMWPQINYVRQQLYPSDSEVVRLLF